VTTVVAELALLSREVKEMATVTTASQRDCGCNASHSPTAAKGSTFPVPRDQISIAVPRLDVEGLFKAFSDRTRLRILHLLLVRGEMCVGDLVNLLEMTQPRISQHLACLRHVGLVEARREGVWTHYALAPPGRPFSVALLQCLAQCVAEVPELNMDALRAESLDPNSRCCP
jgi:ArsR family transcriptional regulator, arsenate/arsenite/antimonite-responsive transcriptional repressor